MAKAATGQEIPGSSPGVFKTFLNTFRRYKPFKFLRVRPKKLHLSLDTLIRKEDPHLSLTTL